jgi:hypothetical protein
MSQPNPIQADLEKRIVAKAIKDLAFRRQLIANPRAAIEAELGAALPADLDITVIEMATPNTISIVLPPALSEAGEMSDAELESVAGGALATLYGCVAGATCRGSGCGEAAVTVLVGGGCSRIVNA